MTSEGESPAYFNRVTVAPLRDQRAGRRPRPSATGKTEGPFRVEKTHSIFMSADIHSSAITGHPERPLRPTTVRRLE
jgi:hypothetical protein